MWWLRLGIEIERIKPGNPQQNGRHERMHLTLKLETTKPAGNNFLQQQAKFDDFIDCYNNERPHQALNMRYPAERYVPSTRPYKGLPDLDYLFHDKTRHRDHMRAHLLQSAEDQSQRCLRRSKRRHQTGERAHLARQLHGL